MPRRVAELKHSKRSDSPRLMMKPTLTVLPRKVMSAANWPTMSSGDDEPKPKKSTLHGLMLGLFTSSAYVSSSITLTGAPVSTKNSMFESHKLIVARGPLLSRRVET